jgi:hypothetical protein
LKSCKIARLENWKIEKLERLGLTIRDSTFEI